MKTKVLFIVIASFIILNDAIAQIPVELFAGEKKISFDLMFFKFIKNSESKNTKFLFFNRNRTNIDYKQTTTSNLPTFGFTEAISYNDTSLYGFAPVFVTQIGNRGVYPKAGLQFYKKVNDLTFFSWVVSETLKNPNIDFFLLARYEPSIAENVYLFSQIELVNSFPTLSNTSYNLFQRLRLGVKYSEWQFGVGADFSQYGINYFISSHNLGVFLRHEF